MLDILTLYLISSFIILFVCGKVSYQINLVDLPSKRKIHLKATAYTGGIIISLIYLFALKIFNLNIKELNMIISVSFLISIVGFIDDKYHLNAGGKLSLQIISVLYLIAFENLNLTHIGDYNYFKLELGTFSIPFTLLCVLYLINSFNYFDGIDGTLSFTFASILLILFFLIPDKNIRIYLIILLIPVVTFLLFNFSLLKLPKLFLGDSGSLLLGFIISFLLIFIGNKNIIHPILLAWSVVIFVYEFLSINIIRLKNKKGLFQPGKDHLHHILYKKNKSIFLTNFKIFFSNILLFSIGYSIYLSINALASLILFIFMFMIYFFIRNKFS
tara:strand:+ start:247 stop:1233 length:987 start_codon:yes stop_codon:yes gene_type:complete